MLYDDDIVRKVSFRTPVNPNLLFNEITILRQYRDINPGLVSALEWYITNPENEVPQDMTTGEHRPRRIRPNKNKS